MAFVGCSDPASLVFHLNELGLEGVARHLKDIAGLGDTRRVVPTFAAPKMSSASPELVPILKALHLMSVKKQREEFRETMITNEDSEIVRRIMADKDTLPVELVRFRTLEKELGKEKFNLLLNDEMKRNFVFGDEFQCSTFVQFVSILAHVQLALMFLFILDSKITDSVHEFTVHDMVREYLRNVDRLARLQEELDWYVEFYCPIVVSRMRFFLDGTWNGKFNLAKLITSKPFIQFVYMDHMDIEKNPFSVENTTWLYSLYVKIDSQKEGMLTQDDMRVISIDGGKTKFEFSQAFLSRLFEKLHTFNGKLDFALFLCVIWPLAYMGEPQAARFFVDLFDLDEDGRVGILDLRYFYKSIYEDQENADSKVTFDWFMSEIYDMCQCREEGFTADMLIASGEQEHIIKMMIDMNSEANSEGEDDDPFDDDGEDDDDEDDL